MDFVMVGPARCPHCDQAVTEKTLVRPADGDSDLTTNPIARNTAP